jgi:alkylation response protein AidB-like acyl-CoA dehydrogenase
VPADHGGFGEGPASQVVVQRELGRALVQEPVIPSGVIATAILAHHAPAALQAEWLPAIASGDKIFTLAYLEPDSRYRPEVAGRRPARPVPTATCSMAGSRWSGMARWPTRTLFRRCSTARWRCSW